MSQSIVDQSGDRAPDQQAVSTADLTEKVTPSVFQILCYEQPPATVAMSNPLNIVVTPPAAAPVEQPASVASTSSPLDIPRARTGIVRHPKGIAPIKSAADGDARAVGQAINGSPVQVLETYGDWYRVLVNGETGYMHYTWVRVNQFEEPSGDGRFVQVKSFVTLPEAKAYVRQSPIPLAAHLAANGWIAVTLHDIYAKQEAKDVSRALKSRGLVAKDAMVTLGNTYVRKVCCD